MPPAEYDDERLLLLRRRRPKSGAAAALYLLSPHIKRRLRLVLELHVARALGLVKTSKCKRQLGTTRPAAAATAAAAGQQLPPQTTGSTPSSASIPQQLLEAAHTSTAELRQLLDTGLDIDSQESSGLTAVALASRDGRLPALQCLLKQQASTYVYTNDGVSPLMLASRAGHLDAVKALLMDGAADAYHVATSGRNALMEAAAGGHSDVVEALIDLGGADPNACCEETGTHALLEAAHGSHVETAAKLLALGTKVNLTDKEGRSALLVAARSACQPLVNLLLKRKAKSIPTFIQRQTPLHAAAAGGHLGIVAALLAAGAKADVRDAQGCTPADVARTPALKALLQSTSSSS